MLAKFEVPLQYLPGGTEETIRNLARIIHVTAEIRTDDLPSICLCYCRRISLLADTM